ncbi:MAG: T9SS type A sorting domain-containing protein [Bacteroidia bacterium]
MNNPISSVSGNAILGLLFSTLFCCSSGIKAQQVQKTAVIKVAGEEEDGERTDRSVNCGGTERWGQKVLIDTAARSINFAPDTITVTQFDELPAPVPNSYAPRTAPLEFQTFAIHCHIIEKRFESDNDFHLIMYDGALTGIAEIPDPACAQAASSTYVNDFIEARNFTNSFMGPATSNNYSVNIPKVIVTGVGFVDPPHGQSGVAPNNMELHPVLHMAFEDPTVGIQEKYMSLHVTVGPNPFSISTEFQINSKLNNLGKVTLTLFDILGEEVQTTVVPVLGNSQIDYVMQKGDLKPGVYIYRFRNEGSILYEGRLVIQ